MILTISWGSLVAGDEDAVGVSEEAPPDHIFQIFARIRYQIPLMSNSITVAITRG